MKSNLGSKAILIIMTVVAVVGLMIYAFLFHAMQKSHERIMSYTNDVERADQIIIEEASLKRTIAEIGPDLEKIRSYQVSSDGVVGFIEMIERLGKDSGVGAKIDSVNVVAQTEEASSTDESLMLSLSFSGSWKNCMHFVSLLESLPYDISISRLGLATNLETIESMGAKKQGVLPWSGKATLKIVKQK